MRHLLDTITQRYRPGLLGLWAAALSGYGCTSVVSFNEPFPQPVVEPLPIHVGVYYHAALRDYVFEKGSKVDGSAWEINVGPAHIRLFDTLFEPMFQKLVAIKDLDALSGRTGVDIVIVPAIEEYTLDSRLYANSSYYEVTIRYKLTFYTPAGEPLRSWWFDGHGRSRYSTFDGKASVKKATVAAMRDAASWLVTDLEMQPEIRELLDTGPLHSEEQAGHEFPA